MDHMEVMKVQNEVSAPIGQRGSEFIRRPMQGETPVTGGFQARHQAMQEADQGIEPGANPAAVEPSEPKPEPSERNARGDDEWAHRHAQLLKRERMLHAERQKIRERENRIKELEELMDLRERDPKGFVEKNGLSYEKLTDIYLNDGKKPPEHLIQSLEEKIKSLEARLDNDKTQSEENWAQEKITGFKRQIQGVIDNAGETFELIQAQKAHDLVYDVIQDYYRETKTILPIEEAAQFVEDNLFEEAKQLSSLKKLQALHRAPEPQPKEERQEPTPQDLQPQRTPRPQQSNPFRQTRDHVASNAYRQALEESKRNAARMLRFNR